MKKYTAYSIVALSITMFVLVAMVGDMDYNSDMVEFDRYCTDVHDGIHPDYKKIIDKCE